MKSKTIISIIISILLVSNTISLYYISQYQDKIQLQENKITDLTKNNQFRTDNYGTLQKARERSQYIDQLREERTDTQNKDIALKDRINTLKDENTKDIEAISGFKIYFNE